MSERRTQIDQWMEQGAITEARAGLSELLAQLPGAGLVVTTTGLMPLLPEECRLALRSIVQKPYNGEHLLRVVGSILGGSAPASYTEA